MQEEAKKRTSRITDLQKEFYQQGMKMAREKKKELLILLTEKMKANKENVKLELLETVYKVPFLKLKNDLKAIIEAYTNDIVFEDILIKSDADGWDLVGRINKYYKDNHLGNKIGAAVYKDFNIDAADALIREYREWALNEYKQYIKNMEA